MLNTQLTRELSNKKVNERFILPSFHIKKPTSGCCLYSTMYIYISAGFVRPVVLLGPIADVCRDKLMVEFPEKFTSPSMCDTSVFLF